MLLGALTVVILVAGDPSGAPFAAAIEQGLRTSLGSGAEIDIRPSAGEGDEALLALAAEKHANLLGVVTWSSTERRATIRFVRAPVSEPGWADREIHFGPTDAAPERGRTVGFALASILPDDGAVATPLPPPTPPPAVVTVSPASPERMEEAPLRVRPSYQHALEATAQVANGIAGYGGGLGGAFAFRLQLADTLWLRIAVGARGGDVSPAQASARLFYSGAGVAWQPWLDASQRWAAGFRVDGLVMGNQVVHLDADDVSPVTRFRVLPGADGVFEGVWRFAEQAAAVAAVGAEVAFGRTDVYVADRQVAQLAPVRAVVEGGLRVSF